MHWLLWAALLAFLLPGGAAARVAPALEAGRTAQLLDWAEAWIDQRGDASPAQVAGDPALPWQPASASTIYPLGEPRALWLRFSLPPTPAHERWYLEVGHPAVNRVTLYARDAAGGWSAQSAGDQIPVSRWPVPHRQPLLPLALSPDAPRAFLMRVENRGNFSAPLLLESEREVSRSSQGTALVLGMYFGLALLALVFSLLGAVTLRDRTHAAYALVVLLMALTQAAITGIGGLHLWPDAPWWSDRSPSVLPVLVMGALLWFFGEVMSVGERSARLHRSLAAVALAAAPLAALILVVPSEARFLLMAGYVAAAVLLGFGTMAWAMRRGDPYARWVFVGMVPVFVGGAFPLARAAGWIPMTAWAVHSMQIGIALELPVLLMMLLLRSQRRREHARRMQGLDRLDPATGLINAQVFHERLERLIVRSQRLKVRSAVLLVDIVNLDQIRREFGRESGRELPLHVAGRLLAAARNIDSVARLSEHRFGLLLEGPLKASEVAEAAPRIVARCLMPFRRRPLAWTAQVRVAQALVPMHGTEADLLVRRLEELLAAVPADSKRAVYSLGAGPAG